MQTPTTGATQRCDIECQFRPAAPPPDRFMRNLDNLWISELGSGLAASDDSRVREGWCRIGLFSGDGSAMTLEKQRFLPTFSLLWHLIGQSLSSDANRDSERDI